MREGTEGRALLYCFAGCQAAEVVAALGLRMPDLFAETYRYDDGRTVVRSYDAGGRKQFRQSGNTRSVPTLYRLGRVREAVSAGEVVYLVEGEKDVHALDTLGVTATTAPMGAGNIGKADLSPLSGAQVVAVVDVDEAGRKWAATVVEQLPSVELVTAAAGKDAADHVGAGYGLDDFKPYVLPRPVPAATLGLFGGLLADLRAWQHLPDPTHVVVALATAATRRSAGEPLWVLLVAPPSSGKTETVRLLDDTADARLDEVSAAGLIGWSRGKTAEPCGVLPRVGSSGLVTFGDLSSLLATSDRGGRDQVFALLRRAYDGHVTRDVAPPGRTSTPYAALEWSGRLTVVACVTGAIDRYSAHADALGARWVYVRLPERSTDDKRAASALARRGGLAEHRASARQAVAKLLAAAAAPDLDLPEAIAQVIEDAALVAAWGRASVPRNGYGRREIEGVPVIEEPMRLVQQLGALASGVRALGLPNHAAAAITRRVALDSMPEARRATLATLAEAHSRGEMLSTAAVARLAGLDRKVARNNLEEFAAVGVVENDRYDEAEEEPSGTVRWMLSGTDGALIADVFTAHRIGGGWDETWVLHTPSPPIRGSEDQGSHINPTLRPTPEPVRDKAVAR